MRVGRAAVVAVVAVWVLCGAGSLRAEEQPTWDAQVLKALRTPPDHPRRAMLVFPLVEAGSRGGAVGWGRGLTALQAMWRSSFAPDRLLDTWDFWVNGLYTDQQLVGPGRTVTPQKIENVCASFQCPNYVTGTLAMDGRFYKAQLVFHGDHGKRTKLYIGPREEVYRLPCAIARDVVAYMGVKPTAEQAAALSEPCLPSSEAFDREADRFLELLPDQGSIVNDSFWTDIAHGSPTHWQADMWLLNAASFSAGSAEHEVSRVAKVASREAVLYTRAAAAWRRACDEKRPELYDAAARQELKLVTGDPCDPHGPGWLVRALAASGRQDLADAAVGRFQTVFGKGVLAAYLRGAMMVVYAWDGRSSKWAKDVTPAQWRMFDDRLARARQDLEWVVHQDPRVWKAGENLISVAMGMGLGDGYAEECFRLATGACPTDYTAYASLEYYYTPKWGGSVGQMLDVGRRAADTHLYQAGIPFLLVDAYWDSTEDVAAADRKRVARRLLLSKPVRSRIDAMLDGAERSGSRRLFVPGMRLLYAYWDGDRARAQAILKKLRDPLGKPGDYMWDPTAFYGERFSEIRQWVENPLPPLLEAARAGKLDELNDLIDEGADLGQRSKDGSTALILAARYGKQDIIKRLVQEGADVNAGNDAGDTPLIAAIRGFQPYSVRVLLTAGADVRVADKDGNTPLHLAASVPFSDMVKSLVSHHASLAALNDKGRSPLHLAVSFDLDQENLPIMLAAGGDPNVKDHRGQTPLHYAAGLGRIVDLRALLAHGADVNLADSTGITPLHRAAASGFAEAARILLEHGAKVDAVQRDKWTPLAYAARNGHAEAARVLLDAGADVESRDKDGTPPLHKCAYADNGGAQTAALLLERGAEVNARDRWQTTALHAAASQGNVDMARLLLEHGADIDARQQSGRTPLWTAASSGKVQMVRLLASKGADLNAKDKWDLTPLHAAAEKGQTEVARALLAAGADPNALNNDKLTPADIAEKRDHPAVAALLRQAAAHPAAATQRPAAGG